MWPQPNVATIAKIKCTGIDRRGFRIERLRRVERRVFVGRNAAINLLWMPAAHLSLLRWSCTTLRSWRRRLGYLLRFYTDVQRGWFERRRWRAPQSHRPFFRIGIVW